MSRGFGAMQHRILKTMEAAMRYELHDGALATPYTTLSFLERMFTSQPEPHSVSKQQKLLEFSTFRQLCSRDYIAFPLGEYVRQLDADRLQ